MKRDVIGDPDSVDIELYEVDRDDEFLVVCGCHGWAFETYRDFHDHCNGPWPTIVDAEHAAAIATSEARYREWARENEFDPVVIAEVREPTAGGYSIDVPSDVGEKTMRSSYAKGYEAWVDGLPRDANPYNPNSPEYDGWSGFVRARQKRWWQGWEDARDRLNGKDWVDSHRTRPEDPDSGED